MRLLSCSEGVISGSCNHDMISLLQDVFSDLASGFRMRNEKKYCKYIGPVVVAALEESDEMYVRSCYNPYRPFSPYFS